MRHHLHFFAGVQSIVLARVADWFIRVDHRIPSLAPWAGREIERHRLVVGVEEQEEAVIDDIFAARAGWDSVTAEEDADASGELPLPVVVRHRFAVGLEPADVAHFRAAKRAAVEPAAPLEGGMRAAELDQAGGEREQFVVDIRPVEPRDLVVLAVGVVVAVLRPPDLIAAADHWYADGEDQ